jgi:hypothetical protein
MGDAAPPAANDELVNATAPLAAAAMDATKGNPKSISSGDGSKAGMVTSTEASMSTPMSKTIRSYTHASTRNR